MSTRILVTLENDADADEVVRALYEAGAESVTPPQPELPDVAIATFDVDDLEPRIASIRTIAGVSEAEADSWRDAFADSTGDFDLGMPSPAVNEDPPENR